MINIFDMLQYNVMNDPVIKPHQTHHNYDSNAALLLESFNGDDDKTINNVCTSMISKHQAHGTILKPCHHKDTRK